MKPIRRHSVKGISGIEYLHGVHYLSSVGKIHVNGVYIVYCDNNELVIDCKIFKPVYVGKAVDQTIAERFSGNHGDKTDPCFIRNGARFIGVISVPENTTAEEIEIDLIMGLNPDCNKQHRIE